LPPLRTIGASETEGIEKGKKKKFFKKLVRIKKLITFAPRLTTESQQESGFELK